MQQWVQHMQQEQGKLRTLRIKNNLKGRSRRHDSLGDTHQVLLRDWLTEVWADDPDQLLACPQSLCRSLIVPLSNGFEQGAGKLGEIWLPRFCSTPSHCCSQEQQRLDLQSGVHCALVLENHVLFSIHLAARHSQQLCRVCERPRDAQAHGRHQHQEAPRFNAGNGT